MEGNLIIGLSMLVSLKVIKKTVKGSYSLVMGRSLLECFLKIKFMGKVNFISRMGKLLRGFGKKVYCFGNYEK